MNWEDVTYTSDFLEDATITVSYIVNIPAEGIFKREIVEKLEWFFMTYEFVERWKWYFKYRAALLQVKYPKYDIEIKYSTSDMKSKKQQINLIQRRITAKKRKVTEFFNKAEKVKNNHRELFPVEDNPLYKKLREIEATKRSELAKLEYDLQNLKQQ